MSLLTIQRLYERWFRAKVEEALREADEARRGLDAA